MDDILELLKKAYNKPCALSPYESPILDENPISDRDCMHFDDQC